MNIIEKTMWVTSKVLFARVSAVSVREVSIFWWFMRARFFKGWLEFEMYLQVFVGDYSIGMYIYIYELLSSWPMPGHSNIDQRSFLPTALTQGPRGRPGRPGSTWAFWNGRRWHCLLAAAQMCRLVSWKMVLIQGDAHSWLITSRSMLYGW